MRQPVIFSLKPVLIKTEAYPWGADSESLMLLRMLYAALYLLILWIFRAVAAGQTKPPCHGGCRRFSRVFSVASYLDLLALSRSVLRRADYSLRLPQHCGVNSQPAHPQHARQTYFVGLGLRLCRHTGINSGELNLQGTGTGLFIVFASALSFAIYVVISGDLIKQFGSMLFTAVDVNCHPVYANSLGHHHAGRITKSARAGHMVMRWASLFSAPYYRVLRWHAPLIYSVRKNRDQRRNRPGIYHLAWP